jgi:hypothetical protein
MEHNKNQCTGMDQMLADLLLDPDTAPVNVTTHVAGCDDCHRQLEELRATMALLDAWEAPQPNPYFMTRFEARMREERKAAPAGWFERLRARILLGPHMHARPLAAMALTVLLLMGGGTYLGVTNWEQPVVPDKDAAVVHDLQTLDSNAQLLDQLESISGNNDADDLNQN